MASHKPILVTGSHRSGTTWVGRMLAEAPSLLYIHEPFSVTHAPSRGICNTSFAHWYTSVTVHNEAGFTQPIRNMIDLKYDLQGGWQTYRLRGSLRRFFREYLQFLLHGLRGSKVLIKDPMAFFSADWMAARFDMDVVMVIRHPAAFVSSIKKLNWRHPFSHFLEQPALMRDHLNCFADDIREYAAHEHDLIDEAILLWKLIHFRMIQYLQTHPDWIFIRHEDLSRAPLEQFRQLYSRLGLEFTRHAQHVIERFSSPVNPGETDVMIGTDATLMRNSFSNIWNWKNRLTPPEIERIRYNTEHIWRAFYADEDW